MNDKRILLVPLIAVGAWAVTTGLGSDQPSAPWAAAAVPLAAGLVAVRDGRSESNRSHGLDGASGWINSPPLTSAQLRGKVVLIDFWTYSCINWRRQYPHVRDWATKYKDKGLVVVGVHSPEFSFERDIDNVQRAVREIGVRYPVAVDSEHRIWRAYENAYWPALYFIDGEGRLRHHHFGEGDYEASEKVIQQLLQEAGATAVPRDLVQPIAHGSEAQPDWENLRTPETYVGYGRSRNLASTVAVPNRRQAHEAPRELQLNQWALAGDWTVREETAVLDRAGGRIAFAFHARDLHLVMGPVLGGTSIKFRVTIDGKLPGPSSGVDVDAQGVGTIDQHRMYQLIRQPGPIRPRRFEIEFLSPGVEVFSFTFG